MPSLGDEIAGLVIEQYDRLPRKGKPLKRSNGVQEWSVLAGVVVRQNGRLSCVSLATGVKATPDAELRASHGRVLHDCHAEILAIRAFNRYVLLADTTSLESVYLYVCTPPCGDASLGMLSGESWSEEPLPEGMIRGRAHFNVVGRVRTKPGRNDSPLTMSKSCSDKLCLRQSRGLLLAPVRAVRRDNVFLTGLVCPEIRTEDFERAFSRFEPQHRFEFIPTAAAFPDFHPSEGKPSPTSLIWWQGGPCEVVANGLLQGSRRPSSVSRISLSLAANPRVRHYYDLKSGNSWPPEWVRTTEDDFTLDSK